MLNTQDANGFSPLHIAIRSNKPGHVQKLIMLGANTLMPDGEGNTPLHFAAEVGGLEMLNSVAEASEDLDVLNNEGETPVMLAAHSGHLGAVVALTSMDKHVVPANTSIVDHKGRNLLMHACISGNIDLVRFILLNKEGNSQRTSISRIQMNVVDMEGMTALMHTAAEGHWPIISLLVLAKANIAAKDNRGFSALHHGVSSGDSSTVAALLDCGAFINETDNDSWTPLMHAVNETHVDVCQLLLDYGADPNHCIGLAANSRPIHLALCDAIRDQIVGDMTKPIKISGKFVVSILNATDLYIDPSAITNGKEDIAVYAVVQFKTNGDPDDAEMVAITPAVCIPPMSKKITKFIEWNEPLFFFLKERTIYPDSVLTIEFFATRDYTPINDLLITTHAAGEDKDEQDGGNEVDKRRERIDRMYREIQVYEQEFEEERKLEFIEDNDGKHSRELRSRKRDHEKIFFAEIKRRWSQMSEMRKRFEKFQEMYLPLPPVPLSHYPCGSIVINYNRLREIFRGDGKLVQFSRYPRFVERGLVRFDVDFFPSLIPSTTYREIVKAPDTPKQSDLPPIEGPEFLYARPEVNEPSFATRYEKYREKCRKVYANYWIEKTRSSLQTKSETKKNSKSNAMTPKEYSKRSAHVITVIAQHMVQS